MVDLERLEPLARLGVRKSLAGHRPRFRHSRPARPRLAVAAADGKRLAALDSHPGGDGARRADRQPARLCRQGPALCAPGPRHRRHRAAAAAGAAHRDPQRGADRARRAAGAPGRKEQQLDLRLAPRIRRRAALERQPGPPAALKGRAGLRRRAAQAQRVGHRRHPARRPDRRRPLRHRLRLFRLAGQGRSARQRQGRATAVAARGTTRLPAQARRARWPPGRHGRGHHRQPAPTVGRGFAGQPQGRQPGRSVSADRHRVARYAPPSRPAANWSARSSPMAPCGNTRASPARSAKAIWRAT